jgi:glycosyltransferase involved in cell wall biosynthesis
VSTAVAPRRRGQGPLRLAVFHTLPPGGARRALYELVRRSADRIEYHLHRVDLGRAERWPELRRHQDVGAVAAGVTEHRLPGMPRLGPASRILDIEALQLLERRIARRIDSGGYDAVLVSHDQFTSSPSLLRWVHLPSIYLCQEPRRRSFEPVASNPHASGLQGPAVRAYERLLRHRDIAAAQAAGWLVTNSRYTADYITRTYHRDALVCHLGVDHHTLRPRPDLERRAAVLSVGALDPVKGHDLVVEALGRLPLDQRPLLDVVYERGDPGFGARLAARAAALGVELRLHRAVSDARLAELYATARATVCAAHGEPFGLTAIESLSCGTPVVAVAEGGLSETVVDGVNGRVVDREVDAVAAAIASLHAELRIPPDQARAGVIPYWSWDAAADRFAAIVDGALSAVASGGGRSVAAVSRRMAASPAARSIDSCA